MIHEPLKSFGGATENKAMISRQGQPGHRRNLLDARMREVGIGVAVGKHGGGLGSIVTHTVGFGTSNEGSSYGI